MNNIIKNFNAVLFDMDGVLIDSNSVIERAWCEVAQMYDREISNDEMIKHIHGQPGPHTISALFGDLSAADQQKVQDYIIYIENTAIYKPIDGVAELILALHKVGIRIGIVTSGWRQKIDSVIKLLKVDGCISVIVERDNGTKGKPYPDPYLLAIKRLNIPVNHTIVFEDSSSGVKSAVAADTYCVGIGGENLLSVGAQFTITDFSAVKIVTHPNGQIMISFDDQHQLTYINP